MGDSAREATESFERYLQAFNDRDAVAIISEMHFPHMRLVGDDFQRWESSEGMIELEENVSAQLNAEGWHKSEIRSMKAVQIGPNKVHLANRMARLREDGTEYNAFDTLGVFTRVDGRWGVRLRSSFLENAVGAAGTDYLVGGRQ